MHVDLCRFEDRRAANAPKLGSHVVDPVILARIQFGFTTAYHYLFPPFTMGLALLLVILKTMAVLRRDEAANLAVRFWSRLFGVSFIMGVVTGIPLEFQFGTNWAQFSAFAGNIIAQSLAMEGTFAFFLESAFVGLLLFGEVRFGQTVHWLAAVMVFLGTWLSGFFIIVSNAWMQNPVGYISRPDGGVEIADIGAVLFNPWVGPQYFHTMCGAVVTAAFCMAGLGAYYLLLGQYLDQARLFVRLGVLAGLVASIVQVTPTGDLEGVQGGVPPADQAGGHGRSLSHGAASRDHHPGPAEPAHADDRQSDRDPGHPELSDVSALERRGVRAGRIPARPVAGHDRAPLLQLPHHGRAGHALHRHHRRDSIPVVAAEAVG